MKNTILLNPQVASTDKYGNDFFYIFFSQRHLQVKCKTRREKEKKKEVLL
jgi:hypothetical protein